MYNNLIESRFGKIAMVTINVFVFLIVVISTEFLHVTPSTTFSHVISILTWISVCVSFYFLGNIFGMLEFKKEFNEMAEISSKAVAIFKLVHEQNNELKDILAQEKK